MLIEYPYSQRYLFTALEASPDLFDRLLEGITPEETDARPDPERFTIREVMAHLAEWENVFLARMTRICEEETPLLEGYDEGQLAIEHGYDRTDPLEQCGLFRERRARLVAYLRSRSPEQWQRAGNRPEIGAITLEALAFLVPLHDTYHLHQVQTWRQRSR
ncbi:MAG TPA: DinB family protein [Chthonomonadaceae bacterium]|nr:DinB family protein [Chthonomonadaceae bacterium]